MPNHPLDLVSAGSHVHDGLTRSCEVVEVRTEDTALKLLYLTLLITELNAAIDAGQTASLDEAKTHIRSGDVLDWLSTEFRLDVSLLQNPDRRDGRDLVAGLQAICGGYSGNERRKWGIEQNGLALILAWTNELIQQHAVQEDLSAELR